MFHKNRHSSTALVMWTPEQVEQGMHGRGSFVAVVQDSVRTASDMLLMHLRVSEGSDSILAKMWRKHPKFDSVCKIVETAQQVKLCNVIGGQFDNHGQPVYIFDDGAWMETDLLPEDMTAAINLEPLPQGAISSPLLATDPSFWGLVQPNAPVTTLASKHYTFAHEGPVWLPETQEVFFTSNRLKDDQGGQHVETWLVNIGTGELRQLTPQPPILMANGATAYGPGKVLVCSQGQGSVGGSLVVLDVATGATTTLVNNWCGLCFNSPNDIVVHGPSGAILFTDPPYGFAQGYRDQPQVGPWVWRFDPATNAATPVADSFLKPNGVVFSTDFNTAYVTDTGAEDGTGGPLNYARQAPAVYAFDVRPDGAGLPTLSNRRMFAVVPEGIPDGIKVDEQGNVYMGTGSGLVVYSPKGVFLGEVQVGFIANFAFAGRQLVMMQGTKVTTVPTLVRGVQLPLQAAV